MDEHRVDPETTDGAPQNTDPASEARAPDAPPSPWEEDVQGRKKGGFLSRLFGKAAPAVAATSNDEVLHINPVEPEGGECKPSSNRQPKPLHPPSPEPHQPRVKNK